MLSIARQQQGQLVEDDDPDYNATFFALLMQKVGRIAQALHPRPHHKLEQAPSTALAIAIVECCALLMNWLKFYVGTEEILEILATHWEAKAHGDS